MLYEVNANSENWMIAGRKRGYVSLSEEQGKVIFYYSSCFVARKTCILMLICFFLGG